MRSFAHLSSAALAVLGLLAACSSAGDDHAIEHTASRASALQAEFPEAEWIPTSCDNKCNETRDGAPIEMIIIHDTEQPWEKAVATLQNDAGKSSHYIIDVDGRIGQFVTEATNAWHCANSYYNARSIGIEHVGVWTEPYTEAQYAASARLVDYLATKYNIPRDRAHIIGHDQVPNSQYIPKPSPPCMDSPQECEANDHYGGFDHHTDPGVWEWATYMPRFGGVAKCNDATPLWTCSSEKNKAFRCTNDAVEVTACDGIGGCEPAASADAGDDAGTGIPTDAVCNVATTKSSPPLPPPDPVSDPAPAPTASAPAARPSADSGCAVGGTPSGSASSAWPLALLAAAAVLRPRRRR